LNLDDFQEVALEDTFVLAWHKSSGDLVFYVEAHLRPEHSAYAPHGVESRACYRPGIIVFRSASQVTGLMPQSMVNRTTDAEGAVDYGTIDRLEMIGPGQFAISGEFGDVVVHSRAPRLYLAAVA
jgi:hypothetical protein